MKTALIQCENVHHTVRLEGRRNVRRSYLTMLVRKSPRAFSFLTPQAVLAIHKATGKRVEELRRAGYLPEEESE